MINVKNKTYNMQMIVFLKWEFSILYSGVMITHFSKNRKKVIWGEVKIISF